MKLISLADSEKKATSEPAIIAVSNNNTNIITPNIINVSALNVAFNNIEMKV